MTPDLDAIVERPPMTENGTFLSAGLQAMGYDEESANDAIYAIEDEVRDALQSRLAALEGALVGIIGEAEEVTEAQHGDPHRALDAIIVRARAALTPDPDSEERT